MADHTRGQWANLNDAQLLKDCAVDTYRASGPGGQKRNKTSSAVRLRHLPSGLIVIAEESRSQWENRNRALRRLRQALYLHLRESLPVQVCTPAGLAEHPDYCGVPTPDGRLVLGVKDPRFWPVVGVVLDVLQARKARVSEAAQALGISTANLVAFLSFHHKVWEEANQLRVRNGLHPLRADR